LRAIDVLTGDIAWERKLGDSIRDNWSGVVSTAAGLIFFADNSGTLSAARSADGELLWSRHLNARVRASPMTYMLGGRQFVTIAAGKNVLTFALPPVELP
ncbi:MAG: PQQ-binding-like beta-propeller repeat protein, partial [Bryobacterales bacterium]|nr:PQQ-binding-like beta-propeller repeat protein [Bryobacterales bacterium]